MRKVRLDVQNVRVLAIGEEMTWVGGGSEGARETLTIFVHVVQDKFRKGESGATTLEVS